MIQHFLLTIGEQMTEQKNPTQEEVNDYLDALCQSGMVNIYDAAPYVQGIFKVTKYDAQRYLLSWITMMEKMVEEDAE